MVSVFGAARVVWMRYCLPHLRHQPFLCSLTIASDLGCWMLRNTCLVDHYIEGTVKIALMGKHPGSI